MTPYYEQDGVTIYHGDCRKVLGLWTGLRMQSFDLLLTDPPYGIGADTHEGPENHGWRQYESTGWDGCAADAETIALARAICRHAVVWGGNYFDLPAGNRWLVWDKGQRDFSLADGELAWTSERGAVRFLSYARGKALAAESREHPTQKPLEVITWCLSFFPNCKTVLDPFMGSGTTLVAAKRLGRKAIGIELEEKYCEIAAKRLQQGALPLEMGA